MSSHPNPRNRFQAITQEAASLRVSNPVRNTQEFTQIKSRLQRMAPAPTTEQAMRRAAGSARAATTRVTRPDKWVKSSRLLAATRHTSGGNLFRVSVPSNWRELQGSNNSVTFAPEGGYGDYRGQSVFTHGLQVGMEGSNNAQPSHRHQPADSRAGAEQSAACGRAADSATSTCGPQRPGDRVDERLRRNRRAGTHRALYDAASRRQPVLCCRCGAGEGIYSLPQHLQPVGAVAAGERQLP